MGKGKGSCLSSRSGTQEILPTSLAELRRPGVVGLLQGWSLALGSDLPAARRLWQSLVAAPQDVARAVGYLIDPANSFLNGCILQLGGGIHSRLHDPG